MPSLADFRRGDLDASISDLGPSTGGARAVAEHFVRDLERLGFRITRDGAP